MIKVDMYGRLGNQMFQYAYARKIQEVTGQPIIINFHKVLQGRIKGYENGWENSLKYFNVKEYNIDNGNRSLLLYKSNIFQVLIGLIYYIFYKRNDDRNLCKLYLRQIKFCSILNKFGLFWLTNGYYDFNNYKSKNILIKGTFENELYFNSIRDKLLEEFTPKFEIQPHNIDLLNDIMTNESVCVSIRNFREIQNDKIQKNLYAVINSDYFYKAIDLIKTKVSNPKFYIFSDDINYVKENFNFKGLNAVYETGNDPVWEKLRLMYSCKHFIISNSTFSWWAQYLSRNDKKIVIAPERWFNNDFKSGLITSDMLHV